MAQSCKDKNQRIRIKWAGRVLVHTRTAIGIFSFKTGPRQHSPTCLHQSKEKTLELFANISTKKENESMYTGNRCRQI